MQLNKLIVHRLPGLPQGFTVETDATVSVIIGPNGSGKSSLCRAVRHLLWSEEKTGSPFSVEAFFNWDEDQWKAVREEGMSTRWMRNGQPAEAPELPGDHVARCYELGILDLVLPAGGEVEQQLAGIINKEMSGGVNLAQIAEDIFSFGARIASKRSSQLQEATNSFNTLIRNQNQLAEQEGELVDKRRHLVRAENSVVALDLLEKLKLRNEVADQLELVRHRMKAFEPGQGRIQHDDNNTLATLTRQRLEKDRQGLQVRADMALRLDQLKSLDLPDKTIDPGLLARQVAEAVALHNNVQKLRDNLVVQEEILHQTLLELNPETDGDAAGPKPGKDVYSDLTSAYTRLAEVQAMAGTLETLLAMPVLQNQVRHQETKAANDQLRGWLKTPQPENGTAHLPGLFTGIIAAGSGWLLWSSGQQSAGSAAMVLGGAMAGFSTWRWLRSQSLNKQHKALGIEVIAQSRAAGITIDSPLTFSEALRLVEDETRLEAGNQTRLALRDHLDGQLRALDQKLDEFQDQVENLRKEHGLALDRDLPNLMNLLNVIPRFRGARDEVASLGSAITAKQQELDTTLAATDSTFTDLGFPPAASITEAQQQLENLESRLAERKQLTAEKQRDQKELDRLQRDLEEIDGNVSGFWRRLGLAPQDDDFQIRQLVENLPQWREVLQDEARLHQQFEVLDHDFRANPKLLDPAEAEKLAAEQLNLRLEDLLADAQARDEIFSEITRIELRVDQARESQQVAEAQALAQNARDALMEARENERHAILGRLLLEDVEQTYHHASRPRVLARASDNFRDFTQGLYELRVVPGIDRTGNFAAFHTEKRENLGLAQLSDGTRAQLLLAVRLAFIAENEGAAKPPIFLDESLTSSDPERFAAIADKLACWAGEQNRRVFYLSSNPVDGKAWENALKQSGLPQPEVIDLALIRRLESADSQWYDYEEPSIPPAPAAMTAAEYARLLVVPTLDPWQQSTQAHLWYLLQDDLPQLHRLLVAATSTLGPLLTRRDSLSALAGISSEQIANLEARGLCLRALFRVWRIGRSRPVTAEALISSGAIGEIFMDRCRVLLNEVQGNSVNFLEGLRQKRVKRFATKKIDALENYFLEEKYLDPREMLSEDDQLSHVLLAVTPQINAGHLEVDEAHSLVLVWQEILKKA